MWGRGIREGAKGLAEASDAVMSEDDGDYFGGGGCHKVCKDCDDEDEGCEQRARHCGLRQLQVADTVMSLVVGRCRCASLVCRFTSWFFRQCLANRTHLCVVLFIKSLVQVREGSTTHRPPLISD